MNGHTWPVVSLSYSQDGSLIASADVYSSVRIWDLASGTQLSVINLDVVRGGQGRRSGGAEWSMGCEAQYGSGAWHLGRSCRLSTWMWCVESGQEGGVEHVGYKAECAAGMWHLWGSCRLSTWMWWVESRGDGTLLAISW